MTDKLSERLEAAREALDSMDDLARMEASINPIGPRKVLEDFIEAAAELARSVADAPVVEIDSEAGEDVRLIAEGGPLDRMVTSVRVLSMHGQRVRLVPEGGLGGGDYWGAKPQGGEADWTGYDG